jgi:hypothetical protein
MSCDKPSFIILQIYRCWIVYERRWLVITPSLILYLGALATVVRVIDIAVTSRPDETFRLTFCPWAATMFSIHAVQNILTSGQRDPLLLRSLTSHQDI